MNSTTQRIMLPSRAPGETLAQYHRRRRDVAIAVCSRFLSERYIAVAFDLSRARVRQVLHRLKAGAGAGGGVRPARRPNFSEAAPAARRRGRRP